MVDPNKVIKIDNPKNVIIRIKLGNGPDDYADIDITQSFYYRLEEVKKPVYGFNERSFSKVLAGKTIASGGIIIKKHAKESILNKLRAIKEESLARTIAEAVKNKFETIYEILNSETIQESYLSSKLNTDESTEEYFNYKNSSNEFQQKQLSKFNTAVLQEQIAIRTAQARSNSRGDTVDDLFKLGHDKNNPITIKVSFNSKQEAEMFKKSLDSTGVSRVTKVEDDETYDLIFEDVHFVTKEATISVGSNDIDEMYSFIANIGRGE